MPSINCAACPGTVYVEAFYLPFIGDVVCSKCNTVLSVQMSAAGTTVQRKNPSLQDLKPVWPQLADLERQSLLEASLACGVGAYTASELVALRTLEAILRRLYKTEEMLEKLIARVSKDSDVADLAGVLDYFRGVRNRIAHPERVSSKLDAESTLLMVQRLLLQVLERFGTRPGSS